MDGLVLPEVVNQWANDILLWVGFGTLVGLLARAIMPGRDYGGALTTLSMGIGGTIIGEGVLMFLWNGHRVTPLSPLGFIVATGGAFILLFFHRLLGGYFYQRTTWIPRYRRGRAHHRVSVVEED